MLYIYSRSYLYQCQLTGTQTFGNKLEKTKYIIQSETFASSLGKKFLMQTNDYWIQSAFLRLDLQYRKRSVSQNSPFSPEAAIHFDVLSCEPLVP